MSFFSCRDEKSHPAIGQLKIEYAIPLSIAYSRSLFTQSAELFRSILKNAVIKAKIKLDFQKIVAVVTKLTEVCRGDK